jgi:hypothetical protein
MTELDRLLYRSESSHTRALLRAGKAETSPDGFSQRLLASVGAVAAATTISSTAAASLATGAKVGTTATGAALGSVGAAASSGAASSLAFVAAKWVAVGVFGGGILAAGADYALSPGREPERPPQAVSAGPNHANVPEPRDLAPLTTPEPTPSASTPPTPVNSALTKVQGDTSPAPSASTSQLGREVEVIDRVRRALSAGNTSLALSELTAYQRIASTGVLDREARVLHIRALREGGDEAAARKLSDQYLLDFPGDPHATRLRAKDAGVKP